MCKSLRAPTNGRLNCSLSDDHETRCVVVCEDGYDFAIEPTNFNLVNDELLLRCNSSSHIWENNNLPECSGIEIIDYFAFKFNIIVYIFLRNYNFLSRLETQTPKTVSQEGNVILQSNESVICDNQTVLNDVSAYIYHIIILIYRSRCMYKFCITFFLLVERAHC